MIHVLFEEALYDVRFVRDWTNGPFLVRADTQQLLTAQDLAPTGHPETFVVWDEQSGGTVSYRADHGYVQADVTLRSRARMPSPSLTGQRCPAGPPSRYSRSWQPRMPQSGRR